MDNPHFISFVNLLFADDDRLLHVGTDFFIYIFIAESTSDLQKVDKSIRRVCKTPLTSMYFHVCEKNYPASPN